MASATRTVLSIRLRPLFIHHISFPVNICGNSVWNAVRHDEATQPFPQPSDFKGGPVDNLELKSCEIESLC